MKLREVAVCLEGVRVSLAITTNTSASFTSSYSHKPIPNAMETALPKVDLATSPILLDLTSFAEQCKLSKQLLISLSETIEA